MNKRFVFKEDLFRGKMRQFFEKYEGHIFEIDHIMDIEEDPVGGGHVWLICIDDPDVVMKSYVHIFDLDCLNPDKDECDDQIQNGQSDEA